MALLYPVLFVPMHRDYILSASTLLYVDIICTYLFWSLEKTTERTVSNLVQD
jgi:hypothetical protein